MIRYQNKTSEIMAFKVKKPRGRNLRSYFDLNLHFFYEKNIKFYQIIRRQIENSGFALLGVKNARRNDFNRLRFPS